MTEPSTHQCLTDYSSYRQLSKSGQFLNFSIKYVVQGVEHFKVNGTSIKLKQGEYLLAGFGSGGNVTIDSKTAVTGMCMAISPQIISEVLSQQLNPSALMPENKDLHLFNRDEFIENKYTANSTKLGKLLIDLEQSLIKKEHGFIQNNSETYYAITECLLADYLPLQNMFSRVKAVKNSTRKELFRRLLLAKNYIDESFTTNINVKEIAHIHGFSEYHFFRLFKNAFQISPYQYQLDKRLTAAKELLVKNQFTVSDIAIASGFNDVYSFSKAFKKKYNLSPSGYFRSSY